MNTEEGFKGSLSLVLFVWVSTGNHSGFYLNFSMGLTLVPLLCELRIRCRIVETNSIMEIEFYTEFRQFEPGCLAKRFHHVFFRIFSTFTWILIFQSNFNKMEWKVWQSNHQNPWKKLFWPRFVDTHVLGLSEYSIVHFFFRVFNFSESILPFYTRIAKSIGQKIFEQIVSLIYQKKNYFKCHDNIVAKQTNMTWSIIQIFFLG